MNLGCLVIFVDSSLAFLVDPDTGADENAVVEESITTEAEEVIHREETEYPEEVRKEQDLPTELEVLFPDSTGGVTRDQAVAWAQAQIGKSLDYDGAYGCQCVDLIYYYYQALGATVMGGNAIDYATNALPAGWQRITFGDGVTAQPGDIAVWSGWNNPNGHVAIVESADSTAMNVIEQNFNYHSYVEKNWTDYRSGRYATLECFIRPDFPTSQQPKGNVDNIKANNDGTIYLRGWAFDPDVPASHLQLHVYVGGEAGSGKGYPVQCNAAYRPDVETLYGSVGAYHGYELTIPVAERGSQPVYVYAIDEGDAYAGNPLIGSGIINITADYAREISLNPSALTLGVDSTQLLTVNYTPYDTVNKSVSWSSSNTSVATVDSSGKVTGIAPGTATITATAVGSRVTKSCTVTVQAMQTKIKLDRTEITVPLGSLVEVGMNVTGAPEGAYIQWRNLANNMGSARGTLILTDQGTAWTMHNMTGETHYYTRPGDKVYIGLGTDSLPASSLSSYYKAGLTEDYSISCNGASETLHVTFVDPEIPVSSLKLDKTSITMALGDELSLSAMMAPSNTTVEYIYWGKTGSGVSIEPSGYMLSLGTKVGTVADYEGSRRGYVLYSPLVRIAPIHKTVIKAVELGTSTINVQVVGGATATCEVTVINPIPVSSVSLNKTSMSLVTGKTEKLTATVSPSNATDKSLSWSSSNPEVAKVSNGTVSALTPGTAVITASAKNGVKANCTVTVADDTIPVTSVRLNKTNMGLIAGKTEKLTATVSPSNATDRSLSWSSSNPEAAKVSNGTVSALTPGTAIITASTKNGIKASCTVQVQFQDVTDPGQYYFDPVYWAVNRKITSGTTPTTFSPFNTCTRGQIVTFLWKAQGSPEPQDWSNPFTDVGTGDYFYKAVLWAKENGITAGTTATTFSPGNACTRGQIVTFLWKALGSPEPRSLSNPFVDVYANDYFVKAVLWAKERGVTSGTTATTFSPFNACTRAQAMTFLYKAMN